MEPLRGNGSGRRRRLAVVIAVVAFFAVLVVAYLARTRGQSGASERRITPVPYASRPATGNAPASASGTAAASGTTPAPTCAPGRSGPLRQDTRFVAKDGTTVPFSISLPDDYYSACKRYPVIYALHGKTQNNVVFMDEALSMRKAMAAGVLAQSIIVTPDSFSTGRWENRATGPAEDNFIQRLMPHVEQEYRVEPGPSHRLLVGFSMGGHGAIRFGLKYPQLFAAVWSVDGAMSGSENYLPFLQGRSPGDFRIVAVGGRANGDRVRRLVDSLKQNGLTVEFAIQDLDHEFEYFVDEDEKTGWYAMKYLQQNLGRPL